MKQHEIISHIMQAIPANRNKIKLYKQQTPAQDLIFLEVNKHCNIL
jgi:hypothetical protein